MLAVSFKKYQREPFDKVTEWLLVAIDNAAARRQMLLSTSLPSEVELIALLPEAEYMLTKRAGFGQSSTYASENRKKDSQLLLSEGSVLPARFKLMLYDVGSSGKHPVYRLSAPLFLGWTYDKNKECVIRILLQYLKTKAREKRNRANNG